MWRAHVCWIISWWWCDLMKKTTSSSIYLNVGFTPLTPLFLLLNSTHTVLPKTYIHTEDKYIREREIIVKQETNDIISWPPPFPPPNHPINLPSFPDSLLPTKTTNSKKKKKFKSGNLFFDHNHKKVSLRRNSYFHVRTYNTYLNPKNPVLLFIHTSMYKKNLKINKNK